MRRLFTTLVMCCLGVVCTAVAAEGTTRAPAFDKSKWEGSYAKAWETKDTKLMEQHFSKLYNQAGVSRELYLRNIAEIFKKYQTIDCDYHVVDARQFPNTNLAVVTAELNLSGVKEGQAQATTLRQAKTLFSLIFEEGRWRVYATNTLSAAPVQDSINADFSDCPPGYMGSYMNKDKDGWVAWNAGGPAARVPQANEFNVTEWEQRVITAWNRKDPALVADYLSDIYNHVGTPKAEVVKKTATLFGKYHSIECRYKVIEAKLFPETGTVAIKATLELRAVPVGGTDSVLIFSTAGYGSLRQEKHKWRLYATQFYTDGKPIA